MRSLSRVVVSGATSFIGSAVTRCLLDQGCDVYGLVRPSSSARNMLPDHPCFHEVSCDIRDFSLWAKQISQADTFFHFSWGGPGAQGRADVAIQQQNVTDTLDTLQSAAQIGVSRFIFSGSQAEYGQVYGITTEQTPCAPILEYGKCKLMVHEQAPIMAKKLGMEYIHTRIFSVYGPGDHPYTLVPSCIRTLLAGETIALSDCTQKWNFLHVRDAAEVIVLLASCDIGSAGNITVNVASTDTRPLREFVDRIYDLTGRRGGCAYGARIGGERPVDNWPDIQYLQRLTGWTPKISFDDGIHELIRLEQNK